MDHNPYRSPVEPGLKGRQRLVRSKPTWHPLTWAVLGFAAGTILVSPFILSSISTMQLRGGAMYGGPIGAVVGWFYGSNRRRNSEGEQASDSELH